ncbi:universal stress protein, partial [Micromonospora sp. M42]
MSASVPTGRPARYRPGPVPPAAILAAGAPATRRYLVNSADGAAVVVGVDGSEPATRAVLLAAREATRRNRPLRVVHGFIWPLLGVPVAAPAGAPPHAGLRHQAEQLVADAVNAAQAQERGLRITGEIIDGEAAAVLIGESPTAALIVLGDRGLGGFASLVIGSVALQVTAYADCPVLVARGAARDTRPGGGRGGRLRAVPRRRRVRRRNGVPPRRPAACAARPPGRPAGAGRRAGAGPG